MLDITQRGITALKAGDRPAARKFLGQAVKEKPDDPIAWLWLSGAVENDDHRIVCLRQVLRIDPQNQAAVRGLEKLLSKTQQPPPVQTQETVEAPEPPVIDKAGPQIFEPPPSPEPVAALQPQPIEPIQPERNFEPAWRTKALAAREEMPPQRIFRIRPSLVPALACFWLFFIGAILLYTLLTDLSEISYFIAGGVGILLEIIVLFVLLRNFMTQYELTDQYLKLPFRGKKTKIPFPDLLHVEDHRTFWQKIRGTADILIDGVVAGELAHLRMRDIADFQKRIDQIKGLANNMDQ